MFAVILPGCILGGLIGDDPPNVTCPDLCHCTSDDDISCTKLGFKKLPHDLPASTISLNLEGNYLRILMFNEFKNVPSLQVLWVSQNNLTFLYPGAFISLSNLRELNLRKNSRLTYLHAHTFRGLLNLISLDISHCNIFEIHPLVFSHLVSLEALELGFNKIHYIPEALRKLRNVTKLSLENNLIEAIGKNSFKYQQALEDLSLRRNRIWVIESDAFDQLNKLNVLNLGHNSLSYLPNQIFRSLRQLRIMYLEANKISTINCSFNSLVNLKKLHLNNNRITSITQNAFSSLNQLQMLHLSKNNLTFIPSYLFSNMPKLKHVFVSSNPWSCDCRMSWTANWMLTYTGAIHGLHCVFALSYATTSDVFTQNGILCSQEKGTDDRCIEISTDASPKLMDHFNIFLLILFLFNHC
ncbi:nyctalopin-like [Pelobates fuscus]|uniref:nyctalopin-like n=1 Tax=Pelobates fuscus TaxID=191477 RepID=UPI002FE4D2C0